MTDVRGFELNSAIAVLTEEGYKVVTDEVRSIKGVVEGDSQKVIRVRFDEEKKLVYLTFAVFKTIV